MLLDWQKQVSNIPCSQKQQHLLITYWTCDLLINRPMLKPLDHCCLMWLQDVKPYWLWSHLLDRWCKSFYPINCSSLYVKEWVCTHNSHYPTSKGISLFINMHCVHNHLCSYWEGRSSFDVFMGEVAITLWDAYLTIVYQQLSCIKLYYYCRNYVTMKFMHTT